MTTEEKVLDLVTVLGGELKNNPALLKKLFDLFGAAYDLGRSSLPPTPKGPKLEGSSEVDFVQGGVKVNFG